ncbi:MAG: 4-hydroxythreonine-4-phosphate dehydrogenase PdxA [Candidatus Dadabacteria bacterium]|nr:MAG: 4-hydroxythreonine-4-phosphate dehydrogenase PdxA [Candidatus Dadabacteria bacterium]
MNKPVVLITQGDPAGIGPEIVLKATAAGSEVFEFCRPVLVADNNVLEMTAELIGVKTNFEIVETPDDNISDGMAGLVNCNVPDVTVADGAITAENGNSSYLFLVKAIELAGPEKPLVTAPINKEALKAAFIEYPGHTEILADQTGAGNIYTMFETGRLRIFFYTRHIPFKDIVRSLSVEGIEQFCLGCLNALKEIGFKNPRIALAALNPHGGEHGMFGDEEQLILLPAIEALRNKGHDICGPVPADSVFYLGTQGEFDAVISLYHDQGHIAAKTLDFFGTVSVTLGLPFIRTSVDHGTAMNIAGRGEANPKSLIEAIKLAVHYSTQTRSI